MDKYIAGGPKGSVVDSIHVQLRKSPLSGKELTGRFDTALINDGSGGMPGVTGESSFEYCLLGGHII